VPEDELHEEEEYDTANTLVDSWMMWIGVALTKEKKIVIIRNALGSGAIRVIIGPPYCTSAAQERM
jgi:hypothetical protein